MWDRVNAVFLDCIVTWAQHGAANNYLLSSHASHAVNRHPHYGFVQPTPTLVLWQVLSSRRFWLVPAVQKATITAAVLADKWSVPRNLQQAAVWKDFAHKVAWDILHSISINSRFSHVSLLLSFISFKWRASKSKNSVSSDSTSGPTSSPSTNSAGSRVLAAPSASLPLEAAAVCKAVREERISASRSS